MLIGAYGMFWNLADANLSPGSGSPAWELLGRVGERKPRLKICDFRRARGVYILFDDHGAYYTGLALGTDGRLGERIKEHTKDKHAGKWSRFCWFAFDGVSKTPSEGGWHEIVPRNDPVSADHVSVVKELEALLITVLNTRGQNQMNFQSAEQWVQVADDDWNYWVDRVQLARS